MGYNFQIKYKKGRENKIANALSGKHEQEEKT